MELENGNSEIVTWKNFVEHRAFLIVAVVLVVCSKIVSSLKKETFLWVCAYSPQYSVLFHHFQGLSEGIIMPWPGSKLKPKMVLDR